MSRPRVYEPKRECEWSKTLRERIEKELRSRNITQQTIADDLMVAQCTISGVIVGHANPSVDLLYKIAKYLDVSIDYLIGITDVRDYKNVQQYIMRLFIATIREMANVTPDARNEQTVELAKKIVEIADGYSLPLI